MTADSVVDINCGDIPVLVPQLLINVPDEDGSTLGFIAIDRVVRDRCSGGIRMTHDVTRDEVSGLANSMSWKFAFMNIPTGGAKSGIICPRDASEDEKRRRLALFGEKAGPVLRRLYTTGGDIGIGPRELAIVKHAARLSTRERPGTWQSGHFTAFGVYSTITTWLSISGIDAARATAILEGYGSVGQPLARLLESEGVRIVGVSTIAGGLFDEEGLDLAKLEKAKHDFGDECVLHYDSARQIPSSDLLRQKATVLVPGARPWSINCRNAGGLQCDAIIPASNIPITPAATLRLEERGVVVLPDFVCNSGGTFGCGLINRGFSNSFAEQMIRRVYEARLQGLLNRAETESLTVRSAAERICEENRQRLHGTGASKAARAFAVFFRGRGWLGVWQRLALELHTVGFRLLGPKVRHLPGVIRNAAAEAIFHRVVTESFRTEH